MVDSGNKQPTDQEFLYLYNSGVEAGFWSCARQRILGIGRKG